MNMKPSRDQIEKSTPIAAPGSRALAPEIALAARLATIGLFALGALFALHEASALVAPMLAAIVAGIVLSRIGDRAQAIGVPPFVAAGVFAVTTGAAIVVGANAATARLPSLVETAPEIASRLGDIAMNAFRPLLAAKARVFGGGDAHAALAAPSFDMGALGSLLGGLTPALGGVLIFLATLFFFVGGRADLKRKVVLACSDRENRLSALRIFNGVEDALAHYFGSAALIYLALGVITAVIAWVSGLGAPALWGPFVFFACFVPFLGVALVAAALLAAGLSAHETFLGGAAPALAFLVAHLIFENAVLPAVVGRRFEINPFLVFVSIVFWTWMWGPLGAIIAAPLLLIAKIVVEELREEESRPRLPS